MQIAINPVVIDGVTCGSAEISVAASGSVAIRFVPTAADGSQFPDSAFGIVGDATDPDIATFEASLEAAVAVLAAAKGI